MAVSRQEINELELTDYGMPPGEMQQLVCVPQDLLIRHQKCRVSRTLPHISRPLAQCSARAQGVYVCALCHERGATAARLVRYLNPGKRM